MGEGGGGLLRRYVRTAAAHGTLVDKIMPRTSSLAHPGSWRSGGGSMPLSQPHIYAVYTYVAVLVAVDGYREALLIKVLIGLTGQAWNDTVST